MSTSVNAGIDLAIMILSVVLLAWHMFAHGEGQSVKHGIANRGSLIQIAFWIALMTFNSILFMNILLKR